MEPIKLRLLTSLDSINDLSVVAPPLINKTDNLSKDVINAKGLIKKHEQIIDELTTHLAKTESFLNTWSDHINKASATTKATETEQFTTFKTLHTVDTLYLNGYKQLRLWKSKLIEIETLHEAWTMELQSTDEARARAGRVGLGPPPSVNVQLPKLNLAKFDGKSNFHEWWDSFKIAINDNQELPKIQKMIHLKSLITSDAYAVIEGLATTEINYDIAVSLLTERFGGFENTIRNLHTQLIKLKKCKDFTETKKFQLELETICRQLENFGHKDELEAPNVYLQLETKLHRPILRELLLEKAKDDNWNTSAFRKQLAILIKREDTLLQINHQVNESKDDKPKTSPKMYSQQTKAESNDLTFANTDSQKKNTFGQGGRAGAGYQNQYANTRKTSFGPQDLGSRAPQRGLLSNNSSQSQSKYGPLCVTQRAPSNSMTESNKQTQYQSSQSYGGNQRLPPYPCWFCEDMGHWATNCPKFPSSQSRKKKAESIGRCTRCLRSGHRANQCPGVNKTCFYCRETHHQALCDKQFGGNRNQTINTVAVEPETASANLSSRNQSKLLMCQEARMFNPDNPTKSQMALVFLDSGSSRTYVSEDLANSLNLKHGKDEKFEVKVFMDSQAKPCSSPIVQIGIMGCERNLILKANKVSHLVDKVIAVSPDQIQQANMHCSTLKMPTEYRKPDMIIGIDQFWDLNPVKREKLPSGFVLADSFLGTILCGQGHANFQRSLSQQEHAWLSIEPNPKTIDVTMDVDADSSLQHMMHRYFRSEMDEICDFDQAEEDRKVQQEFDRTIRFKESRYVVALPWTSKVADLPSNFGLAIGRLRSNLKSLRQQPDLLNRYNDNIKELIDADIIEEVKDRDDAKGPTHYLPHQYVYRAEKDKLRIVYDASSRIRKGLPSLNDCLYKGPLILQDLAGILLRFRTKQFIVLCDIEKAFLQVSIRKRDRDATRFLWLDDPANPDKDDKLKILRFKRVTFGLICSPYLLAATIKHHLSSYKSDADSCNLSQLAEEVMENLYVDNIMVGVDEEDHVKSTCDNLQGIFAEAGMHLREFASNAQQAMQQLPLDDRLTVRTVKILGIRWNLDRDVMVYNLPDFKSSQPVTKRSTLAFVASVFDPLGLISPILLQIRCFISQLWEEESKWDDRISSEKEAEWHSITQSWKNTKLEIPRKVLPKAEPTNFELAASAAGQTTYQLHAFADASGYGLGTTIYLRTKNDQTIVTNLIFAKSKVKPPKLKNSIPRLELQAVLNTAKSLGFVQKQLKTQIQSSRIYTDSKCVLDWLRSANKNGTYIDNRVSLIREYNVRHVIGTDNPADLASRGSNPTELSNNETWFHGPRWLSADESSWPNPLLEYTPGQETNIPPILMEVGNAAPDETNPTLSTLSDHNRFSNWKRLKRTTVFIFRFLRKMKSDTTNWRINEKKFKEIVQADKNISASEIEKAENFLLLEAQTIYPPNEAIKGAWDLVQFRDKIWRCKGRIEHSSVPDETIYPIYIPRQANISKLILRNLHQKSHHAGPTILLALFRKRFWTPRTKRLIHDTIYSNPFTKCGLCAISRLKPYSNPNEPPLPKFRLERSYPFANTGIDYFGPVRVKLCTTTDSASLGPLGGPTLKRKVWVAIFTCLVTRGVHFELVIDCSAEKMLNAFRRFISRRGQPKLMLSDNGTQFILGSKAINQIWNNIFMHETIQNFSSEQNITWKFITPLSPWRGGAYERLIGITKQSLRIMVGKQIFKQDDFTTLLAEVELIVNQRPITYISDKEAIQPLTPLDFMLPTSKHAIMVWEDASDEYREKSTRDTLIKLFNKSRNNINRFWENWQDHYLTALRERQKSTKNEVSRPSVGDVVLMKDEGPRITWRLARIIELVASADGKIRTANLKTADGKIFRRATCQLYPLEIESNVDEISADDTKILAPVPVETINQTNRTPNSNRPLGARPSGSGGNIRRSERIRIKNSNNPINYRDRMIDDVWIYDEAQDEELAAAAAVGPKGLGSLASTAPAARRMAPLLVAGEPILPWDMTYQCSCSPPTFKQVIDSGGTVNQHLQNHSRSFHEQPVPTLLQALLVTWAIGSRQTDAALAFLKAVLESPDDCEEALEEFRDELGIHALKWKDPSLDGLIILYGTSCTHRLQYWDEDPNVTVMVKSPFFVRNEARDKLEIVGHNLSRLLTKAKAEKLFPKAGIIWTDTVLIGDSFDMRWKKWDKRVTWRTANTDKCEEPLIPNQYYLTDEVVRVFVWMRVYLYQWKDYQERCLEIAEALSGRQIELYFIVPARLENTEPIACVKRIMNRWPSLRFIIPSVAVNPIQLMEDSTISDEAFERTYDWLRNLVSNSPQLEQAEVMAASLDVPSPPLDRPHGSRIHGFGKEGGSDWGRALDSEIRQYYQKETDDTIQHKIDVTNKIRDQIRAGKYKGGTVYIVGSTMTGLGSKAADLDLTCIPEPGTAPERQVTIRQMKTISRELRRQKSIKIICSIYAKVPLIPMKVDGISVDLVFNNTISIWNSFYLNVLARTDKRFPELQIVIKKWAKKIKLIDSRNNGLNSYSISLLTASFLQTRSPPVLPKWSDFPDKIKNLGQDQYHLLPYGERVEIGRSQNDSSLSSLMNEFFKFWSTFHFESKSISVREGSILEREQSAAKVYIEEPFDSKNNAARTMNNAGKLRRLMRIAADTYCLGQLGL